MQEATEKKQDAWASGLDGVVAAQTRLSKVDGERGELVIAGRDVADFREASFAEVVLALLTRGDSKHPLAQRTPAEIESELGARREAAFGKLAPSFEILRTVDEGMNALRFATALLAPEPLELISGLAVALAAWQRLRANNVPIAPERSLAPSVDFLRMMDVPHSDAHARALNSYWATVSDHGMNASTFTARVVVSTGSDLSSAVGAAIGALKGPLHGGAPGPVLDMLEAIGKGDARAWLENAVANKQRIMGMGHRIYRVRDPRADVLEKTLRDALANGVESRYREVAQRVEGVARDVLKQKYPDRSLDVNVEFYTAVLLDALDVPRSCFASVFATGRVAGWCAHAVEQKRVGRLVRPDSIYLD